MSDTGIPVLDESVVVAADDVDPAGTTEKKRLGFGFWLSVGWLVLVVVVAVLASVLPIKDPNSSFRSSSGGPGALGSMSFDHWFGTDASARDVFSRTVWGARVSLVVGFVAVLMGMVIGGGLGMLAGFFRGWFDRILSFVFLVLLSFPALILAILITALLSRSLVTIALVLGILSIAPIGRLSRAATMQFADREFVTASRALGAKPMRILVRELLPNVLIPMAALALLGMAVAIVAEGGLAFLGLSVQSDTSNWGLSWGKLINEGRGTRTLRDAPWISLAPITVLFLTVLALNFAGDKVRQYFDVKELSI